MLFKHPELLYALFLLLIPILIHLFQLRRFQKVDFTNVAFLKKVTLQTRKSSQLKKWLTLLMRLLALACIIFAFAQPYAVSKKASASETETVLYIDNSFSMQAKGPNGPLLQRALQQLYEIANGEDKISWFSNTESKSNDSKTDFKNRVLSIDYTYKQLALADVLLKANQLFSESEASENRLIIISDFQQKSIFPKKNDAISIDVVALTPVTKNNIAIDSAYILFKNTTTTQLSVVVSGQGVVPQRTPVSLYNGPTLIAKSSMDFSESNQNTLSFDIENPSGFKGELQIIDPNLLYDNSLYFSINTPKKIKVLVINEGDADFLQRLFDQSAYEYSQQSFNSLNYNDIPSQNFIILNELKMVSPALLNSLKAFSDSGGSIGVILAEEIDIPGYNRLLNTLQLGVITEAVIQEKKITKINFSHPLYQNVFEKQVTNFQYPKVNSFYNISSNATQVLGYEDGKPFLLQQDQNFLSTASLSEENSNFTYSPLIVPTFINMAQQSLPLPQLYYNIGTQNKYAVPIKLTQDDILTLRDSVNSFIPLQQTKANSVEITTVEEPSKSGNFGIENENTFIENISYNYPRSESVMQYLNPEDWEGVTLYNSVSELFNSIAEENKINSFWKWFVIFAVVFLLLEMLILKFYK
ncbi:MAG: BatA and WFA domain-containing protein [Bacteroidetes bacterium]|nr:BatA and WFA domain-containing protein [Bacteroidota bacterium]